ncbi:MAG: DUF488 family protein [Candidatus Micrarchaeales archaeon]
MFYTFGYSSSSLEDFERILRELRIEVVFDVRRKAMSKRKEFCKESLQRFLKERGILYFWEKELGGFRESYRDFVSSIVFKKALEKIKSFSNKNVLILCMEKDWKKCHRKFIANELAKEGFKVFHIKIKDKNKELIEHNPKNEEIKRKMQARIFCDRK